MRLGDRELQDVFENKDHNDDQINEMKNHKAYRGKRKQEGQQGGGNKKKRKLSHEPVGKRAKNPSTKRRRFFIHCFAQFLSPQSLESR
jgi:hypothetical protein